MPRKRRVEYAGALYHVMSRGDRREDIFLDAVDRHDFIKTLAEASQRAGWQVNVRLHEWIKSTAATVESRPTK